MNRLLFVGYEHDLVDCVRWIDVSSVNLSDYQYVIINLNSYDEISDSLIHDLKAQVYKLINNTHIVIYILSSAPTRDIHLLMPFDIRFLSRKGSTISFNDHDELFNVYMPFIKNHRVVFKDLSSNYIIGGDQADVEPLAWTNVSEDCSIKIGSLYLLQNPEEPLFDRAMNALVDCLSPDLEVVPEPRPEWADTIEKKYLPVERINGEISKIEDGITRFEKEKRTLLDERTDIDKWSDLVTQTGRLLEKRLHEAFTFLEIQGVKYEPRGTHGPDFTIEHGSFKFTIEVEGSKGSINISKGRQLLDWIADAPTDHKGLLIGNPFCEESPDEKPPNGQELFTTTLVEFAKARHLALVDTMQFFSLVASKIKEDAVDVESLLKRLYEENGVVT